MARRPIVALQVALACAVGVVLVGALALGVPGVSERDAAVLHAFSGLSRPSVDGVLGVVAGLVDPAPYVFFGLLLAGVALARGRPRRAVTVVALLVLTGLTTHALKHLCATPRVLTWHGPDPSAFPSGHATAAMTLALCAVLVAPPRLRPLAVTAGGALALAVGYALIVLQWHYPSDVLAGYLIAGAWTALGVAALAVLERPEPESVPAPGLGAVLGVSGAAAAVVGAVVLAGHEGAIRYAVERPSLVAGGLAIAALAAVLPAALSRV